MICSRCADNLFEPSCIRPSQSTSFQAVNEEVEITWYFYVEKLRMN